MVCVGIMIVPKIKIMIGTRTRLATFATANAAGNDTTHRSTTTAELIMTEFISDRGRASSPQMVLKLASVGVTMTDSCDCSQALADYNAATNIT